ncbi:hypothetical protein ACWPKS_15935 [Coraliomargarita sp. W4R72]
MSKAWITIVPEDLDTYLVAGKVSALQTAALRTGGTDPVEIAIGEVVAEIRNNIRACSSNVLSQAEGTIPPELKRHACALIIEAASGRILKLSEDQKTAAENARKLMLRVASCSYPVTDPTDPETQPDDQGTTSRLQVYAPRKPLSRADLNGL